MSREIKFRVWDNQENNFWVEGRSLSLVSMVADSLVNDNTTVLEQYTGLKDKSGVEIYENDIVMWRDGENIRYAQVALTPDIKFLTCDYAFRYGRFAYKDTENHLTVIGNIHENPELLEE